MRYHSGGVCPSSRLERAPESGGRIKRKEAYRKRLEKVRLAACDVVKILRSNLIANRKKIDGEDS